MSRTPRYSVGSLGRLRAKLGKQVVVRMSCVPFHTIYKTAGIVCLSEKPLGKKFRAKTKGDNSPPSQEPQPQPAPETTQWSPLSLITTAESTSRLPGLAADPCP